MTTRRRTRPTVREIGYWYYHGVALAENGFPKPGALYKRHLSAAMFEECRRGWSDHVDSFGLGLGVPMYKRAKRNRTKG